MRYLIFLSALLLSISACDSGEQQRSFADEPDPNMPVPSSSALGEIDVDSAVVGFLEDTTGNMGMPPQFITGEFTIPVAMEVVFGLYDKDFECSKWLCRPQEQKAFASKMTASGEVYTRVGELFSFERKDGPRKLLTTATVGRGTAGWESCHACAPIMGAVQFMQIDGEWHIEALRKDLDHIGAWGELPAQKLVQIGNDAWGIRLDYDYTNQGISEGGMVVIGLVNGGFKVLTEVATSFSNEAMFFEKDAPRAYAYQSDIRWEPGSNAEFWDMVVTIAGKRPSDPEDFDSKISDFEEVSRYRLQGDAYIAAEAQPGA